MTQGHVGDPLLDPTSPGEKCRRKRIDREILGEHRLSRYEIPDQSDAKYNNFKMTKDTMHLRRVEIRDAVLMIKDLERGLRTQLATLKKVRRSVRQDEMKFNIVHN